MSRREVVGRGWFENGMVAVRKMPESFQHGKGALKGGGERGGDEKFLV